MPLHADFLASTLCDGEDKSLFTDILDHPWCNEEICNIALCIECNGLNASEPIYLQISDNYSSIS